MHAVVIADFAQPSGGAQSVAIQSAVALASAGVSVTYIHGIDEIADPRLAAAGISCRNLRLADIWDRPKLSGALSGIWDREAARRLRDALAGMRAGTVLHLHQWTRSLSPSVMPILLAARHPLAITLHDYFAACPNGVYYRFERDEPCGLRPLTPGCLAAPCDPRSGAHKAIRVARTAAVRLVLGRAARPRALDIVHVSDRGLRTVAPLLPAGLRHHRIDNPVAVTRAEPARIGPGARIAYVGRLTREKGADLVAAAAREAGRSALFVGEGPAEAEIRRLDPDAEVLGWRSAEEVKAILRRDVLAVAAPSRWFETGPLTIYEAQAAGLPVVASIRSGAAEKVVDGETGFVVEPEVGRIADAFRRLAEEGVAARMGEAAYQGYWRAPLDGARHAGALLEVYDGMLSRHG